MMGWMWNAIAFVFALIVLVLLIGILIGLVALGILGILEVWDEFFPDRDSEV